MKIWYQSMTTIASWPTYNATLRKVLSSIAESTTQIEVHGIEKIGGVGTQYRYLEFLETQEVLENVEKATQQGFDAFLIGNICDPGLREAREITDMPVIGLGETSCYIASLMGGNFSVVTGSPKLMPRIIENFKRYGHTNIMHSALSMQMIRLVDLDLGFSDPILGKTLIDQFLTEVDKACEAGAEVIVPAVGVLMVLLAREEIYSGGKMNIPIVNGVKALVKMGEAAVQLRAAMGNNWTSRRCMYQQPPASQLTEIRKYYGNVYSEL